MDTFGQNNAMDKCLLGWCDFLTKILEICLHCKLQKVEFVKNAWAYHKNLNIKVNQIGYMYSKQVVMVNFSTSKSNFQNFGQKVTPT